MRLPVPKGSTVLLSLSQSGVASFSSLVLTIFCVGPTWKENLALFPGGVSAGPRLPPDPVWPLAPIPPPPPGEKFRYAAAPLSVRLPVPYMRPGGAFAWSLSYFSYPGESASEPFHLIFTKRLLRCRKHLLQSGRRFPRRCAPRVPSPAAAQLSAASNPRMPLGSSWPASPGLEATSHSFGRDPPAGRAQCPGPKSVSACRGVPRRLRERGVPALAAGQENPRRGPLLSPSGQGEGWSPASWQPRKVRKQLGSVCSGDGDRWCGLPRSVVFTGQGQVRSGPPRGECCWGGGGGGAGRGWRPQSLALSPATS